MFAQRVGDGLRTAARDGPSDRVGSHAEHQSERGAQRLVEGQNGVCCQPGEERLGSRAVKPILRQCDGGWEADQPKMREQKGMPGEQMYWTQDFRRQYVPPLRERAHESAPLLAVFEERSFCIAEIALQHHGGPVVERMR